MKKSQNFWQKNPPTKTSKDHVSIKCYIAGLKTDKL